MDWRDYFYKIVRVSGDGQPLAFAGTAFPVTPDGGILTAKHVVDVDLSTSGDYLAIANEDDGSFVPLQKPMYPEDAGLDIAFIPRAMPMTPPRYFPILTPSRLTVGEDIYSFGFFALGGQIQEVEHGYFSGRIVSVSGDSSAHGGSTIVLPYPVIEGMSGCPLLTYHNGVKLVGLAFGNRSSRILAAEVLDYEDSDTRLRETIHRIVEFGLAYHAEAIVRFLGRVASGQFTVSSDPVNVYGLT